MKYTKTLFGPSFLVTVAGTLFCGVAPLHASLALVDIFKNVGYAQTSASAPTTPVGYFADVEASLMNPGDYDSVTVTYPGPGSPLSLPLVSPTQFGAGPSFTTQAEMDAAIPFGTYTYVANNSGTSATETDSLSYLQDAYTTDIPALDAATFAALQGMDPSQPFTFNFNSFTPSPNATYGETFLTIFGTSFGVGLSNTATSTVLPANTLLPSTTYTYELDFSDRVNGTDPNTGVPTLIGFDIRTDGSFTTAPEPSAMLPLGVVFLGFAAKRMRRRAA